MEEKTLTEDECHLVCWAMEFGLRFAYEARHDYKLTLEDRNWYGSLYNNMLMLEGRLNPGVEGQWRALRKIVASGT